MFGFFTQPVWSPYLAGAGIGILSCLALVLADRPLGCSTAFVKARGLIGKMINPEKTEKMAYYQDIVPKVDWAFMIIPGIIIGAFFFFCPLRNLPSRLGAGTVGIGVW